MKRGFTLVELSIVLVIIGLLTGGILAGRSLIKAAKYQSFTAELQGYSSAATSFKQVYGAWPGDSSMFSPPGNEDGILTQSAPGCAASPNNNLSSIEVFQPWGQLSQAEMIEKKFQAYSPQSCSGPHHNTFSHENNVGLVAPYSQISGKTLSASTSTSGKISYQMVPGQPFTMNVTINVEDVAPMNKKLGRPMATCMFHQPIGCNTPQARYGRLEYPAQ